jgi:hypothetical protein
MSEPDSVSTAIPPSGDGCADCDQASPQGWWFHLRRCAVCGHIGCCDASPAQHATAHFRKTGHRLIQSFEPGEDWYYDFGTERMLSGPELAPPTSHPEDQPAPGPVGRVPRDWVSQLHR